MIGINDLAFGYADKEILDNYNAIINKIKTDSKETEIYIQSVLPINKDFGEFKGYMHLAEKIIQLNTALENIAKENNTTYINLYDSFILNNQMNPE
jgi:lysophospholipase L1-like esterase